MFRERKRQTHKNYDNTIYSYVQQSLKLDSCQKSVTSYRRNIDTVVSLVTAHEMPTH